MFDEVETVTPVIPGGYTSKLQPLDVSVNKPFKAILRSCWIKFVHEAVVTGPAEDRANKIRPATKQQLVQWIVTAWEQLKEEKDLIVKSFQVTGLTSTDPALVRNDETLQRVLATLSDGEQPLEDPEEKKTRLLTIVMANHCSL